MPPSGNNVQKISKMSLTFDVEEWPPLDAGDLYTDHLSLPTKGMYRVLEILQRYRIKATFFTTGFFAEKRFELMQQVAKLGHEIACHGYVHQPLISLDNMTLKREIAKATKILRQVTNVDLRGFRAPKCLIHERIIQTLEELGYEYDSSIHPTFIPDRYVNVTAPTTPYNPSRHSVTRRGKSSIVEIPISVTPVLRLPLSWWWLRNIGAWWSKVGYTQVLSQGDLGVFYAHPWEFVSCHEVKNVPFHMVRNTGWEMCNRFSSFVDYLHSKIRVNFVTLRYIADMYRITQE